MLNVLSQGSETSNFREPRSNTELAKKPYSLTIPCKSYIKKFVASVYGSPAKVDKGSMLGVFLIGVLNKQVYEKRNLKTNNAGDAKEDNIVMELNNWQFSRIGFSISHECVVLINNYLEHMFDEALYSACLKNSKYKSRKTGYRANMERFCLLHKIELELDISYEALKKKEYRYRKALENKMQEK